MRAAARIVRQEQHRHACLGRQRQQYQRRSHSLDRQRIRRYGVSLRKSTSKSREERIECVVYSATKPIGDYSPSNTQLKAARCQRRLFTTRSVTIARVTGTESVICEYSEYDLKKTSLEVAVYTYSHKDGAFPAASDSGSIIVDG